MKYDKTKKDIDKFITIYGYYRPIRIMFSQGGYKDCQTMKYAFYSKYPSYIGIKNSLASSNNRILREFVPVYKEKTLRFTDIKLQYPIVYKVLIHFYKNTKRKGSILKNFENEYNIILEKNLYCRKAEELLNEMSEDGLIVLKTASTGTDKQVGLTSRLKYLAYKSNNQSWIILHELKKYAEDLGYQVKIKTR